MPTLVYSDADGRDRSFALGSEPVTVGRSADCAIRSEDPRVSRMHARFFLDQGSLWIEDLGSTHGVYVGPNKVTRAQVPTGEMMLVGSLLIRLVPPSGTMPPPMGLHGTLATWLDLERKTRAAVEEERDAFAQRVGELHQLLAAKTEVGTGRTLKPDDAGDTQRAMSSAAAEAVRLRDEAEARAAALEQALAAVQDELLVLRERSAGATMEGDRAEWSTVVGGDAPNVELELEQVKSKLDESESARSIAEHAIGEAMREAQAVRQELDQLRRTSQADLEVARLDLAKTREAKAMVETASGIAVAEKLAEADLVISSLQAELATLKVKAAGTASSAQVQELTDQVTTITARVEKADKELAAAQIRAQGAERNLSHASAQAAKAESKAAQLETKVADAEARAKAIEEELRVARDRIAALETRAGAGDAPLQAAEARAGKLAAEIAELTSQFETSRARIVELETQVATAEGAARDTAASAQAIKAELATATARLTEADTRATSLQRKLEELSKADASIAAAAKTRDDATSRATDAEQRVTEAVRRAEDAAQRASAADTMAKAMAKDVAEALRRAADSDTQKRGTGRELAEVLRRLEQAEAKHANVAAVVKDAEDRVAQADARSAMIQQELTAKLESTTRELAAKLGATQQELVGKLEAAQRELAAERKTSLALVDRKTGLERELADARAQLPVLAARAEAAELRATEHEVQIETLQDRVDDLESGMAVSETAQQASLAEARERVAALEHELAELKHASGKGGELVGELRATIADLENRLAASEPARDEAETGLRVARSELTELVRAAEQRATTTDSERERLDDAVQRASEAERKIDALSARAEAADLAIGRAGALQRQLDEALSKLAWLERDAGSKSRETAKVSEASDAVTADRLAAAETRVQEAEARARDAETKLVDADRRVIAARGKSDELTEQLRELERRAQLAEEAARAGADAEQRVQAAQAIIADAERRARDAEARLASAEQHAAGAEAFERQLFDAQNRITELENEVAKAENVRSFAAETEREIAQLQRDLREARTKLTQATLERDRLAADLRDTRGDSETTSRRAPLDRGAGRGPGSGSGSGSDRYDPEVTAQADLSKYEPIIAKANELQGRVAELEREDAALRKRLADTEQRLRDTIDGGDDDGIEPTQTGAQLPIAFAEHLGILEESIDSLRANMRAASDETAMMDQTDSVVAVSSAVSQAAEHVERARAAIRAMNASIGIG